MESKDFKNVFLAVLTERIVRKQTRTLLLHKGGLSRDDFLGGVAWTLYTFRSLDEGLIRFIAQSAQSSNENETSTPSAFQLDI